MVYDRIFCEVVGSVQVEEKWKKWKEEKVKEEKVKEEKGACCERGALAP
jgi:hypothetical protein